MCVIGELSNSSNVNQALRNSEAYLPRIEAARKSGYILTKTDLKLPGRREGKVRDTYTSEDGKTMVIISTDRQSGFDRQLATIPFKGTVLNLTSQWWMDRIAEKGIVKHHLLSVPHPNVSIGKVCKWVLGTRDLYSAIIYLSLAVIVYYCCRWQLLCMIILSHSNNP